MCRQHHRQEERRTETQEQAYEGATRRLDPQGAEVAMGRSFGRGSHFPWWVLWFIWPLGFLVKGMIVAIAGAVTALATAVASGNVSIPHFLPLLLIVVGIMLLKRWR
jgi:hypothetical protein